MDRKYLKREGVSSISHDCHLASWLASSALYMASQPCVQRSAASCSVVFIPCSLICVKRFRSLRFAALWPEHLELGFPLAGMQNWGVPAFGKGKAQPAYGKASPAVTPASGPYGDKAKPEMKPGDWICPTCGDHQFARNWFCKMCAKNSGGGGGGGSDPMSAMMAMMMSGGFGGGSKGNQVKGDPQFLVYVGNIDWKAGLVELLSFAGNLNLWA